MWEVELHITTFWDWEKEKKKKIKQEFGNSKPRDIAEQRQTIIIPNYQTIQAI